MQITSLLAALLLFMSCQTQESIPSYSANTVEEIILQAEEVSENPYWDVALTCTFTSDNGVTYTRPGFWDGGTRWVIRFNTLDSGNCWTYRTQASKHDEGLDGKTGSFCVEGKTAASTADLQLLGMSAGKRSVVKRDGSPFLLIGDTPWALPFRATAEQTETYAAKRQAQGFNTALLMTIQPDTKAEGPEARNTELGFARGFADLHEGHIRRMNSTYFQYLDSLTGILLAHNLVPVFQPVFHGFGWKGLDVLGNTIVPEEYVRYCRYLLARYGADPAIWLIAADNGGRDPGVEDAGNMFEAEDYYAQPVGLHYNPCDTYLAEWAVGNPLKHCKHFNRQFQAEKWLDFQWAQTGHSEDHDYTKVAAMYDNVPVKASANGEPTYEGMNGGAFGLGKWQAYDAWGQLFSGGTMGVVYGAASLWQWKVSADEEGWTDWASQPLSWEQALQLEGASYVGLVGKTLSGYDLTDIERVRIGEESDLPALIKPGKLYLGYSPSGKSLNFPEAPNNLPAKWVSIFSGEETVVQKGESGVFSPPDANGWVLIIGKKS